MKKDDSPSFQTVWKVCRGGACAGSVIRFHTRGSFTIDWGDGCVEKVKEITSTRYGIDKLSHQYVNAGANDTYTVSISGPIKEFSVGFGSHDELIEIKQWGDAQWETTDNMFCHALNMICTATDVPDLSKVRCMMYMFSYCEKFNSPIEHWDTKGVTDISGMLSHTLMFNQPLAKIDFRNVVIAEMLLNNTPAFNQDLRDLNIGALDTDELFGSMQSLAQYNERHAEKFDAKDEKQDVYSALNNAG